jgi:hypothetical protein
MSGSLNVLSQNAPSLSQMLMTVWLTAGSVPLVAVAAFVRFLMYSRQTIQVAALY